MADTDTIEPGASSAPPEASAPPPDLGREATDRLADVGREKIATNDKVYADLERTTSNIVPRLEEMVKHAGVEAEKLKPWDADAEFNKRKTDPVEAFGSIGSVFGIIASAWTHAPMENALNASAAAMQAIKAGDKEGYERAYKASQDNAKLALERHKIQHDAYQDAVSLLSTNMALANAKLQVNAARFGDRQVQALLESGMSKEVQDLLAARQKASLQLAENLPKIEMANAEISRLYALGYDSKNPTSEQSQKALVQFRQEKAELKRTERSFGLGSQNLTTERQRAQDIAAYRAELRDAKNEDGSPKYTTEQISEMAADRERLLKQRAASATGNRLDDLKSLRDRSSLMMQTIDKAEQLMAKHNFITGIGGKIGRAAEVAKNITGISDETDRAQFARYISELQEWGSRVLNESKGRPLSSEVAKLESILPGLRSGDTIANTIRAYREIKPLVETIQRQLDKRIEGNWEPAPNKADPAAQRKPSWMDAPLVER